MASVVSPRRSLPPPHATSRSERRRVTEWYVAGALIAFAVSLIGASLLELHHDLYLLGYFTVVGTFLASFVAHMGLDWRGWLRARLWWSVAVGSVVAFAVVATVPTALTGNAVGAIVIHDAFHVAANVHTYRSATFLPPDLAGYAERGGGGGTAGLALAALWMVVAGTLIYVGRRRLFPTSER